MVTRGSSFPHNDLKLTDIMNEKKYGFVTIAVVIKSAVAESRLQCNW